MSAEEMVPAQEAVAAPQPAPPTSWSLCACGIPAGSTAPRCKACPARGSTAVVTTMSRTDVSGADVAPSEITGAIFTYSRWKKSAGTFGPFGRITATVLLIAPIAIMLAAIATGIGIVGAGIYLFLIVPRGLRDIWKPAATIVRPPTSAGSSAPRF